MKTGIKRLATIMIAISLLLGLPGTVWAAENSIDPGNTAFILLCSALVMFMTPGLALFYGGMVRKKNVLSILMQCFTVLAIVSVQWVLAGYTLAFGSDHGGLIGSLEFLGLQGMAIYSSAGSIPPLAFVGFQLMFAVITGAIICGSFAERMNFTAFVIFILLWTTLVYDPLAHWVWGGGWLGELGALDFAGGSVVHISSGVSGLVAALVLGRRVGHEKEGIVPHNLPMTITGASLLWFGWFGFNAGSALAADGLASLALLVTNTCAATAALSWVATEWMHHGKPTVFGSVSGAVAGLVAITPAAGFVSPLASIIMGLLVGPICYLAISRMKEKLAYDDSLDAFGIHGVGGTFGALATGVFASTAVNPAGADGLLASGGIHLLAVQSIAVAATYIFAGIMTFLILKFIQRFLPLRVSNSEEEAGLDISLQGEVAYNQVEFSGDGQNLSW